MLWQDALNSCDLGSLHCLVRPWQVAIPSATGPNDLPLLY